ncbi:MAG: RNA polymerase sporulation sigma factor SigK [Candidatus Onthomonas sp.]|nr:RNA polymerase sporulation sigma factor SigK [Candidatus Onthomonas sp.]
MLSILMLLFLQGNFAALRLGSQGSFPKPLSAQEERLALEQAAAGDRRARDRLIEHNLRLVAHIVKKYYTQTGGDSDDLISIGTVGLIKAVNTYNAEKKIKLATYAARCIENEILMYLRKTRRLSGEVSLNDALDQEDEGNALSLMDVIRVEDTMLEDLDTRDACRKVRGAVERCLTEREQLVVLRRYGLDGQPPQTQREVAAQCGISRSYVSRIEKKALEKLKVEFGGDL